MRFVLLLALVGCAHEAPRAASVVEVREELTVPAAPQRLTHVVTLGRDAYLPGQQPAPSAAAQPPVVIQNVITVQPPAWGYYGGYGYGYPTRVYSAPSYRSTPVNPVTGTPPVAGDWPAPPSPGTPAMR